MGTFELSPGEKVGQYTIELGLGGSPSASTWLAFADEGERVVLRLVERPAGADSAVHAELERLIQTVARISKDLVAGPIDIVCDEARGTTAIVSPMSPHPTLADLVEVFPLTPNEAAQLLRNLALATSELHVAGVVHQALKPSNVFVAPPPDHAVTVADAAMAVVRRASFLGPGARGVDGSLVWLAPEQFSEGEAVTPACDVFTAALLVFYAITGKPLWRSVDDEDESALIVEIAKSAVRPGERARELGTTLPSSVDEALSRALMRSPSDRYASLASFADAFDRAIASARYDAGRARSATATAPALPATMPVPAPAERHIKATQKLVRFELPAQHDVAAAPAGKGTPLTGRTVRIGRFADLDEAKRAAEVGIRTPVVRAPGAADGGKPRTRRMAPFVLPAHLDPNAPAEAKAARPPSTALNEAKTVPPPPPAPVSEPPEELDWSASGPPSDVVVTDASDRPTAVPEVPKAAPAEPRAPASVHADKPGPPPVPKKTPPPIEVAPPPRPPTPPTPAPFVAKPKPPLASNGGMKAAVDGILRREGLLMRASLVVAGIGVLLCVVGLVRVFSASAGPKDAELEVVCTPQCDQVSVGGRPMTSFPLPSHLAPGDTVVVARRARYLDATRSITLVAGEKQIVRFTLVPAPEGVNAPP